jgi:hypothetical protein
VDIKVKNKVIVQISVYQKWEEINRGVGVEVGAQESIIKNIEKATATKAIKVHQSRGTYYFYYSI